MTTEAARNVAPDHARACKSGWDFSRELRAAGAMTTLTR